MPEDKTAQDQADDATENAQEGAEGDGGTEGTDDADGVAKRLANAQSAAKRAARDRDRLKAELAAVKAELEKNAKPNETVDPEAIAKATEAKVRAEIMRDRALDKVEVLAAKSFANPSLAAKLLSSDVDNFVVDGKVDVDAIREALAELLEAEPYLAAAPEKRFRGTADQGNRGGKEKTLDDQIREAAAKGDVMAQIRLQNQKMLPQIKRMQGLQQS